MSLQSSAQPAVEQLANLQEEQLYVELGKRLRAIRGSASESGDFAMAASTPAEAFGAGDELKALGRKFFVRWSAAAYDLVCGAAPDDASARKQVADAFSLGPEAIAASVAAILVSHLGMAAALAAVVASLT